MRELAPTKEMTGAIEAVETVHVSPQVSGMVVKVHVADGAEVKAGDPILDIDDRSFVAAVLDELFRYAEHRFIYRVSG